jgi:hypothetical protein
MDGSLTHEGDDDDEKKRKKIQRAKKKIQRAAYFAEEDDLEKRTEEEDELSDDQQGTVGLISSSGGSAISSSQDFLAVSSICEDDPVTSDDRDEGKGRREGETSETGDGRNAGEVFFGEEHRKKHHVYTSFFPSPPLTDWSSLVVVFLVDGSEEGCSKTHYSNIISSFSFNDVSFFLQSAVVQKIIYFFYRCYQLCNSRIVAVAPFIFGAHVYDQSLRKLGKFSGQCGV